ncbi:biotin--[acetyl-CoA-carboxylase] ligase [Spirochaeta dissipatitropha]
MIVKNPWNAPVFHYSELSSTMDIARSMVKKGTPHGTALLCDYQSRGRGRGPGRTWHTKPGDAMLATIILDSAKIPEKPAASLYSAHICSRVLNRYLTNLKVQPGLNIEIKWPNDLMLKGRKLGGILCEMVGSQWLLCGIGINISSVPDIANTDNLQEELRRPATCLADAGVSVSAGTLLQDILLSFFKGETEDSDSIISRINSMLFCRGCSAEAVFPDKTREKGVFAGIDRNGAALLETESGIKTISNADLSYVS